MSEEKPKVHRATLGIAGAIQRRKVAAKNWQCLPELAAVVFLSAMNFGCSKAASAPPPPAISVTISPRSANVPANGTQLFVATVVNDATNKGVTWTVGCSTPPCGSISPAATASGAAATYTAPPGTPASGLSVTVTATSLAKDSAAAGANVTVPGTQLSLWDDAESVEPGGTAHFYAAVVNGTGSVNWSLSCTPASSPCGSVSPTTTPSEDPTTYTAPPSSPPCGLTVTFTATLATDSAIFNSGTIAVLGITVAVTPTSASLVAGSQQTLSAAVTNDASNSGVIWSVSCNPAPCGTLSPTSTASGASTTYTAPATPPASDLAVTITAASAAFNGASATAAVTVPAIVVSNSPPSALIPLDATQQYTASVSNDPTGQGVTWTLTQGGTACAPACGTVSPSTTPSGTPTTYNAPSKLPNNPAVTITASSVTDTANLSDSAILLTSGTVKIVPTSFYFGRVLVHHTASSPSVMLTNTGKAALSIAGISLAGKDPGDFAQTSTCGSTVDSGLSCLITATFTPTEIGTRSATVAIADNSPDSPQSVSLQGVGYSYGAADRPAVRASLASAAVVAVPSPTGPDLVGTRTMYLSDPTRLEPFLGSGTRELLVRFWYPASLTQPCRRADYASPRVWSYFSQLIGVHLPEVITNSCVDASISDGVRPVVVFTPGYTGTFTDYTFLFEDLASRGYVIAAVDHTYEATAVEFPDGRFIKSKLGSHLANTWRGDEATLAFATSVRLRDLTFVLNELERLNQQLDDPFAGKLDASRIAIAGHSMGGATAWLTLEREPRFRAAVILDSYLPAAMIHPTELPVLILNAGRAEGSADQCRLWSNLLGPRLLVNLSGAEHVTPSDAVWLAKGAIQTGDSDTEKTVAAIRDAIASFLNTNLKERTVNSGSTDPSSARPGAIVNTGDQPICFQP
ncbi:MAG TPA: choice-of-anchor D domain-containing protein [Candidatus Solibacter sp.]|nr:choice-of-anchor D domain-containing protein [Candidatus Solibacter sp.]